MMNAPHPSPGDQGPPLQRPCGICRNPAADIKSHIIPRCEQRRLKDGDDKFIFVDATDTRLASEHANRFWQKKLLCQACETRCAELDDFWASFSDKRGNLITRANAQSPWVVPNVDVAKLMTFLISVLLRAHASDRREFAGFSLDRARGSAIAAFHHGNAHSEGFRLIAQLPKLDGIAQGFRAIPHRSPGGSGAVLWFGGFRFVVGFPDVAWDEALRQSASQPETRELLVVPKSLDDMPEYQHFLRTLSGHKHRTPPRRSR
jgi:hypothetical protein